jgi:antitoxin FitA
MTTISIPLSDERMVQLQKWAEQSGLTPEEFLRRRVEQLLEPLDEQFRQAAAYVLQKNTELYQRLA